MAAVNVAKRQITVLTSAISICNGVSRARSAVVAAGGTGYKAGDTLTITGGTNLGRAAMFRVTRVTAGGVVAEVETFLNRVGGYTSAPANPVATTSSGAGTGCTLTVTYQSGGPPEDATAALLQAETQAVRFVQDGSSPTASTGTNLAAGDSVIVTGNLANVFVIEATATAKLNVTFYR